MPKSHASVLRDSGKNEQNDKIRQIEICHALNWHELAMVDTIHNTNTPIVCHSNLHRPKLPQSKASALRFAPVEGAPGKCEWTDFMVKMMGNHGFQQPEYAKCGSFQGIKPKKQLVGKWDGHIQSPDSRLAYVDLNCSFIWIARQKFAEACREISSHLPIHTSVWPTP